MEKNFSSFSNLKRYGAIFKNTSLVGTYMVIVEVEKNRSHAKNHDHFVVRKKSKLILDLKVKKIHKFTEEEKERYRRGVEETKKIT